MIAALMLAAALDGHAIPAQAVGTWAPIGSACSKETDLVEISPQSLQWYDATGYVLLSQAYEAADAEEGSVFVRLEGVNADSAAVFWQSNLAIRVQADGRLKIDRLGAKGERTATIAYNRCPPVSG